MWDFRAKSGGRGHPTSHFPHVGPPLLTSDNLPVLPTFIGFQILRKVLQVAQIKTILEFSTQLFDLENVVGDQKVQYQIFSRQKLRQKNIT